MRLLDTKEVIAKHPGFSKAYENPRDAYIAYAFYQYQVGLNKAPGDNTVEGLDKINRDDILKSKVAWSNQFSSDAYQKTQLAKNEPP